MKVKLIENGLGVFKLYTWSVKNSEWECWNWFETEEAALAWLADAKKQEEIKALERSVKRVLFEGDL